MMKMPTQEQIQTNEWPIPTTDIIIEYQNGIVLVERRNPPYGLAIPGGFAERGLSLPDNARKEAREETGLEIIIEGDEDEPFCVMSDPDRDPRYHMISATYIAKGVGELKAGDDAKAARVYTINEVKDLIENDGLAFDHAKILIKYLKHRGYIK
jgi:ADP-ribose pyrophosphatase YjhB (NUDIX family)